MLKDHKQLIKVIVLVAAIALLSVLYVCVDKKDDSKKEASSIESKSVLLVKDLKDSDIKKVSFTSEKSKDELTFERKDDTWVNKDHKSWETNDSLINSMVSGFVGLTANGTIDTKEDKKNYGFDKPMLKFKFVVDKKEYKGEVGMAIPTTENFYCMMDGDDTLYSIDSNFVNLFNYTDKQLVHIEELENVDSNNIYYVDFKPKKGKELEIDFDGDLAKSAEHGTWHILKGYDTEVIGDHNGAKKFFSTFNAISLKEFVDDNKDNWSKYGLDEPTYTLKYKYFTKEKDANDSAKEKSVNHSVKLYFGDKKELDLEGNGNKDEYYYVRTENSDCTYLILASDVDAFSKPDIFECVSKFVNDSDLLKYKDMVVEVGDDKYVLSETSKKEKVKSKDDDGKETEKEETKYFYKYNDKDVKKAEKGAALYNEFMQLALDGEVKDKVDNDKVIAKITYHGKDDNKDVVIKFLPYNDNMYRVNRNGDEYFTASKTSVDKALESIKKFEPEKD